MRVRTLGVGPLAPNAAASILDPALRDQREFGGNVLCESLA